MNELTTKPFSIGSILIDSWRLIKGSKKALWSVNGVAIAISIAIVFLITLIYEVTHQHPEITAVQSPLTLMLFQLSVVFLTIFLTAPFVTGSFMTAIKHCRGEPITTKDPFNYRAFWIPSALVLLTIILLSFVITFCFYNINMLLVNRFQSEALFLIILMVENIVSGVVYSLLFFAIPLLVDDQLKAGAALRASFQLVKPHLIKVFILFAISFLLLILASIPFVTLHTNGGFTPLSVTGILITIGLYIWILPYVVLILAKTYTTLRGH